jgi:hypothetical protein
MEQRRSSWTRGIATLLAAGLLAGGLLASSAGGAAKPATKKFVNKKVKNLNKNINNLNHLTYVQSGQVSVLANDFGQAEAVCPAGTNVLGGGGSSSQALGVQIDSYPSQGVGFPGTVAPIGHTGWAFEYATGGTPETIRAYAICKRVVSVGGYAAGGAPGRRAG